MTFNNIVFTPRPLLNDSFSVCARYRGASTQRGGHGDRGLGWTRTHAPNLSQTRVMLLLYGVLCFIIVTTERMVKVLTEIRRTVVFLYGPARRTPLRIYFYFPSRAIRMVCVYRGSDHGYTVPTDFHYISCTSDYSVLHYSRLRDVLSQWFSNTRRNSCSNATKYTLIVYLYNMCYVFLWKIIHRI